MAANDWVGEGEPPPSGGTWWDTAKNVGQTVDDTVRAAANAMTFGMADRLAGYMGGEGTDAEVAKSEAARARSPYASVAGDVAGSLALPGFGAEALAARYGSGLGARALGYGVTGAATGAAQGAGNTYTGNISDYARNALIGGALGGTLGAAGGAAFGRRPAASRAETPTTQELYARADADYGLLRGNQAAYEPPYLATAADKLRNDLFHEGYHPDNSPEAFRAIDRMRLSADQGGIDTPGSIESIRQMLNRIPKGPERATDRDAARVVRGALDDFITQPPLGAVRQGTERAAGEAAAIAQAARDTWAGARRGHTIDNLITNAELQAASANSGRNVENIVRQNVKNLMKEPAPGRWRPMSQFNDEEAAALNRVVNPGWVTDRARTVGNMLGGGGGVATPILSAALGTGGGFAGQYFKDDPETGAAIGTVLPFAGIGLRSFGNSRARANIQAANDLIHQRNPLYQYRLATSGMQPGAGYPATAKGARDAIALELLKQTQPQRLTIDTTDWQ